MEIRRRCFLGKPWFDYPISFITKPSKSFFNAEVSISESNQAFFPIMSVFSIPISGVNLKQPWSPASFGPQHEIDGIQPGATGRS